MERTFFISGLLWNVWITRMLISVNKQISVYWLVFSWTGISEFSFHWCKISAVSRQISHWCLSYGLLPKFDIRDVTSFLFVFVVNTFDVYTMELIVIEINCIYIINNNYNSVFWSNFHLTALKCRHSGSLWQNYVIYQQYHMKCLINSIQYLISQHAKLLSQMFDMVTDNGVIRQWLGKEVRFSTNVWWCLAVDRLADKLRRPRT